jgi:hypothetical protein
MDPDQHCQGLTRGVSLFEPLRDQVTKVSLTEGSGSGWDSSGCSMDAEGRHMSPALRK